MKQVAKFIKMINPFNNREDMPTLAYMVKKLLAFLFIYYVAGMIGGEVIIIGGLSLMGYDPLHGVMPDADILMLIQYYGFICFFISAIIYCRLVEKRTISSLGFNKRFFDYFLGAVLAIILLAVTMGICCITGGISFTGIGTNVDYLYTFALLGGLIIQGAAEETLCRGFLIPSLSKKVSTPIAVFLSATAFAYPHFFTLTDGEFKYVLLGLINIYLISIIFSLLMLARTNIWVSCGLHSIWNFLLYGVFGLTLSGSAANSTGIICFQAAKASIFNGGESGIEASIITTLVLIIAVIITYKYWKKSEAGGK